MTSTETIKRVFAESQGVTVNQLMPGLEAAIPFMDLRWLLFQARSLEDKRDVLVSYRDMTGCDDLLGEFAMEQDIFTDIDDATVAVAGDESRWLCLRGNDPVLVAR